VDALEKFRQETREWLEANCPESMRTRVAADQLPWGGRRMVDEKSDRKLWMDRMGAKGWTTPRWPKEYGGGGLSKDEERILMDEMRRINARLPIFSFGISMLGPVLLEYANEEQKQRFIPPIVRGEIRWCQGYSEPGAGSDLAGLQTRAVRDGDDFIVTGQKVWTSYADESDWIFCLVRTDPDQKHNGISFLLFDMESPGVTVKPIPLISGASPFCEVFIQDVRVPADQLVGPHNGGWAIAKRLLQHERSMISGIGGSGTGRGTSLPDLAKDALGTTPQGRLSDPVLRDSVTQVEMDRLAFSATLQRSSDSAKAGQGPGHTASMFKYYGTELNKRKYEAMMSLLGTNGLGWEGDGFTPESLGVTREWLRSKGNSIEGGTSEIQLNVIAKRVLGLPD